MQFGKIDRIVLFIIAGLLIVCVYFLFINKKDTADQSSLLVAMAKKLDSSSEEKKPVTKAAKKEESRPELTEQDKEQIVVLADKICLNKQLTKEDKEFRDAFNPEIIAELTVSKSHLKNVIDKFLSGNIDFTEEQKEFYESNQADIDIIIQDKKYFNAVIQKITSGITEFTEGELQYQQNNPKIIEDELARLKPKESKGSNASNGNELKGAAPPLSADEYLKLILSFFSDNIPKTVTDLSELYADATKSNPNKGNMSRKLGSLEDKGQLKFVAGKGGKIYYGPPEWFVDKKLKIEFCPKDWLDGEKLKQEFKNKIAKS